MDLVDPMETLMDPTDPMEAVPTNKLDQIQRPFVCLMTILISLIFVRMSAKNVETKQNEWIPSKPD